MSVRKKGKKWYARFQIDGVEYERACKGATTEKDALKCEAVIKGEIMQGNYNFAKSKITPKLNDIIKLYTDYSKTNKKTFKNDEHSVTIFQKYWGNCDINKITPAGIESFKAFLKEERENKNATVNRHLQALSKMFNLAIDNGLITVNPMKQVKKLKENNYKIRFLSKNEEERLFEKIDSCYEVLGRDKKKKLFYPYTHLKNIIICALQTGMRRGEIFGLLKDCVDLEAGYIELLDTKSGKARKIPISEKLHKVLEYELNNKANKSPYVFINPKTGTKYTDIKHSFSSLLDEAKIKNFRFHDFRHTVATRLVESGIDLIVVQEILGHANIQTTMRYAHPVPERKKQAIDILSSY